MSRVDNVVPAFAGAGGCDGEVPPGDGGQHSGAVVGVGDANAPGLAGCGLSGELHVAAAVDGVVVTTVFVESSLARAMAQPFTSPDGSSPSGRLAVK